MLFLFLYLVVGVIIGALLYAFFLKKEKEYISQSLNMTLFLVSMPRHDFDDNRSPSKEKERMIVGQMEQILINFLHLKKPNFLEKIMYGPPRVALEIASHIGGKDICFYVAVPRNMESSFEKYVQGVYDRALIEKVPTDYTIFEADGEAAGCYLSLSDSPLLPISTYNKLEKDPLSSITNSLSKIKPDEGAAIQVILQLPDTPWRKMGNKVVSRMKKGESFKIAVFDASKTFFMEVIEQIVKIFVPGKEKTNSSNRDFSVNDKIIQSIQEKIQKPIFSTNIRIVASASTKSRAQEILNHVESSFGQFSLFAPNGFKMVDMEDKKLKKLIYHYSFRNFQKKEEVPLNIEELASIYHFPTVYLETPYIKSISSTDSEPPINLPEEGLNLLGKVKFRGEEKGVSFSGRADRRRHCYFIGQTGTGKSGLLSEMIRRDIEAGEGVGVIDPHGDLIEDTLSNIPQERIKDVVLFNPSDVKRPVGLNMLEYQNDAQKDFAVQEMIAIFHKLFSADITGPVFEHYMRNAMLAVMADKENPGTLMEVSRIFKDDDYLDRLLEKIDNPVVKRFWIHEWKNQPASGNKTEMMSYVVSKIGRFIENDMMRNIIGQSRSGFNLSDIMDNQKIFLANLSKGLVGEMNSSLLGLILVSKIQMGAMRRAGIPEEERKDFYLYVDEFQNFTTDSVATILSEARKYRLNLILAHQYIPQLKEEIRDAVFGNAGTIGSFRVGSDDADFLEKQFSPNFSKFDLVNLDNFRLILKMMINGKVSKSFKIDTIAPKKGNLDQVKAIKEISRLKYGRPKELIDKNIGDKTLNL